MGTIIFPLYFTYVYFSLGSGSDSDIPLGPGLYIESGVTRSPTYSRFSPTPSRLSPAPSRHSPASSRYCNYIFVTKNILTAQCK